jgi:hypothetical protein
VQEPRLFNLGSLFLLFIVVVTIAHDNLRHHNSLVFDVFCNCLRLNRLLSLVSHCLKLVFTLPLASICFVCCFNSIPDGFTTGPLGGSRLFPLRVALTVSISLSVLAMTASTWQARTASGSMVACRAIKHHSTCSCPRRVGIRFDAADFKPTMFVFANRLALPCPERYEYLWLTTVYYHFDHEIAGADETEEAEETTKDRCQVVCTRSTQTEELGMKNEGRTRYRDESLR